MGLVMCELFPTIWDNLQHWPKAGTQKGREEVGVPQIYKLSFQGREVKIKPRQTN